MLLLWFDIMLSEKRLFHDRRLCVTPRLQHFLWADGLKTSISRKIGIQSLTVDDLKMQL